MTAHSVVRRSPLAGMWYPDDPRTLRQMIEGLMRNVPAQPLPGALRALVSPHAGYPYSGQTAAHSYRQCAGQTYDGVIVIGPSHYEWVGDFAVSAASAYVTPLGSVPVHQDLVRELEHLLPVRLVREPWAAPRNAQWEHSVELQLPFLQVALGDFSFVPVLMTAEELEPCVQLGQALAELMRRHNLLLIASSDLDHLESYKAVKQRDAEVIAAIKRFRLDEMAGVLLSSQYTVCGRAPLLTVTAAAQAAGATAVEVLSYTNSGDVTGRRDEGTYTVGYMSAALVT